MPIWLRCVLAALAVWRISHLLAHEDGPWEVVAILRERLGSSLWGKLLDCFKCLSLWVAAPFVFFVGGTWPEKTVTWLALSGAAILIQERLGEPLITRAEEDELLRQAQEGDAEE